jgi:hypothetical protein
MQHWKLDESIKQDDIEFINGCGIDYIIEDKSLLGDNDSGWRDYSTNQRFVTPSMRIIFEVVSDEDLHILKLKFDNRLLEVVKVDISV